MSCLTIRELGTSNCLPIATRRAMKIYCQERLPSRVRMEEGLLWDSVWLSRRFLLEQRLREGPWWVVRK